MKTCNRIFRRAVVVMAAAVLTGSIALADVTYGGGDGSSFQQAVVIHGATESTGVKAEYAYIKKNFPGAAVSAQFLKNDSGKVYDVLEISDAAGQKRPVYFDITEFFGKF